MDLDFGRLGEIISNASIASANRNIGPIPVGTISTSNYNLGSLGLSSVMHNEIYGDMSDFLWSVHTWDDRVHVVT